MKKYFLATCIIASMFCAKATAQVFVIQRGDDFSTYATIQAAVEALLDGDKLFIPPGIHSLTGCTWTTNRGGVKVNQNTLAITKKVDIVGTGYDQSIESSIIRDGSFVLSTGANGVDPGAGGSTVSGVRFESDLHLDGVSELFMSRCQVTNAIRFHGTGAKNVLTECDFNNNVIVNTPFYTNFGTNALELMISKCIFRGSAQNFYNSMISNCIFLYFNPHGSWSVTNCTVNNSIFVTTGSDQLSNTFLNTTFKNNLWVGGNMYVGGSVGCIIDESNMMNVPAANVFTNSAAGDYTLKPECNCQTIAIDGREPGIYGTAYPFKSSKLPAAPHFKTVSISAETDAGGNLPVKITIEAQDR